MKNIHLIPTDKPSRLYSKDGNHILDTTMAIDWYISSAGYKPHNIYITSDEEIKKDEYYLGEDNNIYCLVTTVNFNGKKIILTTDQDLINDGVQGIDDEFLNWFVNNPSCDYVKVVLNEVSYFIEDNIYRIVIPKEEPKQTDENGKPLTYWGGLAEPKQETLEEFIEKEGYPKGVTQEIWEQGVREGTKWQSERMYSEEEVVSFIHKFLKEHQPQLPYLLGGINMWFGQFKKK